jgi:hypothetical protein
MVHAGLDLSRRRLDVCLLSERGEVVRELAVSPDGDGLAGLVARTRSVGPVRGVIESMTGARFVHDELVRYGWEVLVADAQRVKGLAPLACKTDKSAWTAAHPRAMKCSLHGLAGGPTSSLG